MTLFGISNIILQWLSENNVDDETIEDAKSKLDWCISDTIEEYNDILRRNADE